MLDAHNAAHKSVRMHTTTDMTGPAGPFVRLFTEYLSER